MILRLALLLLLILPVRAVQETFYLGTYTQPGASKGIYIDSLDSETGQLGPLRLAIAVQKDPTFLVLSPDDRFLFASMSDGVASFQLQPDGTLLALNHQTLGSDTCHVSLDRSGTTLFAASYGSGYVGAFAVGADGRIGACTAFIALAGSGPNLERQKTAHAHSVYVDPENRFLYVCDLGSDRIWIFQLGPKGTLIPADPPAAVAPPGSGPRHLAFSPNGKWAYVANELGVSTSIYSRNPATGALKLLATLPTIDPGWPHGTGCAEISLHPSGKWLYVSTRLENRMTLFQINPGLSHHPGTQPLQRDQVIDCPVNFPRSFAIDPSGRWMVVAGQLGNQIAVMKIDPANGHLSATAQTANVGSPVCVLFR